MQRLGKWLFGVTTIAAFLFALLAVIGVIAYVVVSLGSALQTRYGGVVATVGVITLLVPALVGIAAKEDAITLGTNSIDFIKERIARYKQSRIRRSGNYIGD